MGKHEEAEKYVQLFSDYVEEDESIYNSLNKAALYSFRGETQKAIEQIKLFSKEENYFYWIVLFFEMDPLMDQIKTHPEFKKTMIEIEDKFWKNHEQIKNSLKEQRLI